MRRIRRTVRAIPALNAARTTSLRCVVGSGLRLSTTCRGTESFGSMSLAPALSDSGPARTGSPAASAGSGSPASLRPCGHLSAWRPQRGRSLTSAPSPGSSHWRSPPLTPGSGSSPSSQTPRPEFRAQPRPTPERSPLRRQGPPRAGVLSPGRYRSATAFQPRSAEVRTGRDRRRCRPRLVHRGVGGRRPHLVKDRRQAPRGRRSPEDTWSRIVLEVVDGDDESQHAMGERQHANADVLGRVISAGPERELMLRPPPDYRDHPHTPVDHLACPEEQVLEWLPL